MIETTREPRTDATPAIFRYALVPQPCGGERTGHLLIVGEAMTTCGRLITRDWDVCDDVVEPKLCSHCLKRWRELAAIDVMLSGCRGAW